MTGVVGKGGGTDAGWLGVAKGERCSTYHLLKSVVTLFCLLACAGYSVANVSTDKVQRTLEALAASFGASRTPPGPSAQGPDQGQGQGQGQGPVSSQGQGQEQGQGQGQGQGSSQAVIPGGSQGGIPVKLPSSLHSSSKLERSQPEASDPNASKDKDGHLLHLELLCMPSMTPVNMVRGRGRGGGRERRGLWEDYIDRREPAAP